MQPIRFWNYVGGLPVLLGLLAPPLLTAQAQERKPAERRQTQEQREPQERPQAQDPRDTGERPQAQEPRKAEPRTDRENAAAQAGESHSQILQSRVQTELAASRSLAGSDIEVQADESTVTLSGTVGSENDKKRAEGIARQVPGVGRVNNELKVDQKAADRRGGAAVGDEDLAAQVAKKIQSEILTDGEVKESWFFGWRIHGPEYRVNVDVDDGTVELSGDVRSLAETTKIIQTVREVPGVVSVRSELTFEEQHAAATSPR